MHYFLIAGEPSGDLHGSYLVEALKRLDPDAIFTFLGGDMMARAAGCKPVIHYNRMAFMGFSEVLRNLSTISANFSAAKQAIELASPDCLILIDYPSFNLKMAAFAHKLSIPVYYYISPKIWAWKKWRVRDIRRNVRMVFSILPFEPEFYRRHKAEAVYVGNPSVAEVDAQLAQAATRQEFLAANNLPDRPLVALMPGSRRNEILNNLAIMQAAMARVPDVQPVIMGAPGTPDSLYAASGAGSIPVLRASHATAILAHCTAALVTSGTATLETALAAVPQVVLYRANGSKISYNIMSAILDIKYVSLPNLIVGRQIIPELLLHNCTPDTAAEALTPLLDPGSAARKAQLEGYADMRRTLGTADAAANTARAIIKLQSLRPKMP